MTEKLWNIYFRRKIYPPACINGSLDDFSQDFRDQTAMLCFVEIGDQVGLWSTLHLILSLKTQLQFLRQLNNLKEPRVSVPEELWQGLDKDVGAFPSIVEQIIAIFYRERQIPPFKELLKIVCGGSLTQACTGCNKQIVVVAGAGAVGRGSGPGSGQGWRKGKPLVLVRPHLPRMFNCSGRSCMKQVFNIHLFKWMVAVGAAKSRLAQNVCDFCFKLSENVDR